MESMLCFDYMQNFRDLTWMPVLTLSSPSQAEETNQDFLLLYVLLVRTCSVFFFFLVVVVACVSWSPLHSSLPCRFSRHIPSSLTFCFEAGSLFKNRLRNKSPLEWTSLMHSSWFPTLFLHSLDFITWSSVFLWRNRFSWSLWFLQLMLFTSWLYFSWDTSLYS